MSALGSWAACQLALLGRKCCSLLFQRSNSHNSFMNAEESMPLCCFSASHHESLLQALLLYSSEHDHIWCHKGFLQV